MATDSKSASRHVVDTVDNLPPGSRKIVTINGRSVGVFNDLGRFYAIRNVCPHHGAPLCLGDVEGIMRPSEPHVYDYSGDSEAERVVRCPWHGYEFRLEDGRSQSSPDRMRVKTYRVEIEDGNVVVYF